MAARQVGAGKLLASALSARLGCTVLTYEDYLKEKDSGGEFRELSINEIFGFDEVTGEVGDVQYGVPVVVGTMDRKKLRDSRRHRREKAGGDHFQLFVKTMKGRCIVVDTTSEDTVEELKKHIEYWNGVPPKHQRLIFGGKQLEDGKRLSDYSIQRESTVFLVSRLCGGASKYYIDNPVLFDPQYNYDFTHVTDEGVEFYRGGKRYYRPCGWERFALRVKGKYENDVWLGEMGSRTESSEGEWPVSYHGTGCSEAGSIVQEGYKLSKGKRFLYGKGIYSTPSFAVAETYAQEFLHSDGVRYKLVFQNRVSTKNLKEISSATFEATTGRPADYYVSQENLIRPYGLCLKTLSGADQRSSCTVS